MQLLIVRHADAGDAEEFAKTGQPDSMRPLSKKGRKQMRAAARTLADLVPEVDVIVSSPLTRAVETREILAKAYGASVATPEETTGALEPDRAPEEFARWLRDRDGMSCVAAVGHEPHLSALVTWLMAGVEDARVQLKKGGACLLAFEERPQKAGAILRWLLTSKQLEALSPK